MLANAPNATARLTLRDKHFAHLRAQNMTYFIQKYAGVTIWRRATPSSAACSLSSTSKGRAEATAQEQTKLRQKESAKKLAEVLFMTLKLSLS